METVDHLEGTIHNTDKVQSHRRRASIAIDMRVSQWKTLEYRLALTHLALGSIKTGAIIAVMFYHTMVGVFAVSKRGILRSYTSTHRRISIYQHAILAPTCYISALKF